MSEEEKQRPKKHAEDAEEIREVLGAVSKEVPALIRSIMSSVFSEQAGRDMGKAAASFYKELKDSGIPEATAVKMTENYISVFTNLGELMKNVGRHKHGEKDIGDEISKRIHTRVEDRLSEEPRDNEEDEGDE